MGKNSLKQFFGYWLPALLAVLGLLISPASQAQNQKNPEQHFFQTSFGDLQQELADARRAGKRGIVLVFEARECPYCARMHNTVLNQVEVQRAYREQFAIFKLAVDSSQTVTDVDGEVLTESALAKKWKVFGTPYTLVISADKGILGRLPGAPINAAEYLLFRDYLLAGGSQQETFAQYKARRKGGV